MQKTTRNTNVVFGVGVSKDETCFEQINVFYFFVKHYELTCFLVCNLLVNLFEDCVQM